MPRQEMLAQHVEATGALNRKHKTAYITHVKSTYGITEAGTGHDCQLKARGVGCIAEALNVTF
jgi:hypothetical protein